MKRHIAQSATVLSSLKGCVESEVNKLWDNALLFSDSRLLIFDDSIRKAPLAILGEFLKRVFTSLGFGLRDFNFNLVERIRENSGITELVDNGKFISYWVRGKIFFFRREGLSPYSIPVRGEGIYDLPGNLGIIKIEFVKDIDSIVHKDETVAYLTYNGGDLIIRTAMQGDYFCPLGVKTNGGTKRLSRYFIDRGIPFFFRQFLPLVVIDNKIAWVGGCGISEDFKIIDVKQGKMQRVLRVVWDEGLSELMRRSELWKK